MNDNFKSILLGNIAYNKDEYADAIRCYTVASNSNSKSTRSDAFLNRSLAHKKLGLIQHARNDFSEAVHSPYKNILVDSVKKKVLPSDEDQPNDTDVNPSSSYGNLFQQFHSNNTYIHSHYNYNNHKKIKNSYKAQLASRKSLEKCFPNSGFFLECSKIQDLKDQNTYQYTSTYKRRTELNRINDYISTRQDSQRGIALGPKNPNYWFSKNKTSFTLHQLETALDCINFFEQRKQQNLNKNDSNQRNNNDFNANAIATINALKKLYSEKNTEDKQRLYNFNSSPTLNYSIEMNNNRLFRIALNVTHGRISEVLYDDPTHPLVLFATRELPTKLESIILNRSPYLSYLLDGILKTLQFPGRKLYYVLKPDLGIDPLIQEKWFLSVKGVPRLVLQLFPQIASINNSNYIDEINIKNINMDYEDEFEYSGDDSSYNDNIIDTPSEPPYEINLHPINNNIDQTTPDEPSTEPSKHKNRIPKNFAPKLMRQAIQIGSRICPERSSLRDAALSGLAALEISQMISRWTRRNPSSISIIDEEPVFPSFDLVLAVVASWLRFGYPSFPILPSRGVRHASRDVEVVCAGVPSNQGQFDAFAPLYARKIVEALIGNPAVSDSFAQFGGVRVEMKRPETILAFTKTAVNVKLEPSKARVYLRPQRFGTYDFGIAIGEDEAAREEQLEELARLWEELVGRIKEKMNTEKTSDLVTLISSQPKKNENVNEDNNENVVNKIDDEDVNQNNNSKGDGMGSLDDEFGLFEFWFMWTIARPLLEFSTASGQIVFAALIHAMFGLAVEDGMPKDTDLMLKAFLANNAGEFANEILRHLTVSYVGEEFESVIDTLPDMQYRTAMLLDVPDEDVFNEDFPDK